MNDLDRQLKLLAPTPHQTDQKDSIVDIKLDKSVSPTARRTPGIMGIADSIQLQQLVRGNSGEPLTQANFLEVSYLFEPFRARRLCGWILACVLWQYMKKQYADENFLFLVNREKVGLVTR
jgi:hypothetical protein